MNTLTKKDRNGLPIGIQEFDFTDNDQERTRFLLVFYDHPRRKKIIIYHEMILRRIHNLSNGTNAELSTLRSFRLKLSNVYKKTQEYLANKKNGYLTLDEKRSEKILLQGKFYNLLEEQGVVLAKKHALKQFLAKAS